MTKIIMKIWTIHLITILLFAGCGPTGREQNLDIIAWQGPDWKNTSPARYHEIVKAGFNAVTISLNDVAATKKALELAEKYQLKLLISDPRIVIDSTTVNATSGRIDSIVHDYSTFPALFGYNIAFAPGAGDFITLGKIVQTFQQKDPDHIAYINLYPSYTSIADLGANSYEQYLKKYFEAVKTKYISFNHFPIQKSGIRADYYHNLELIRRFSREQHRSFWGFVLTWPHENYPIPGESHLRLQAFSNLAYGARGLIYYTYCTPTLNDMNTFPAILDTGMRRTRLFRHVRVINEEINNLASIWRVLHPVGVYHTPPVPVGCRSLDFDLPIVDVKGNQILIGLFLSQTRIPYFLIVNKNYLSGAKPTIYFADQVKGIMEISKNRMEPMIVDFDQADGEKGVGILLKAGDGRLFRIRL